MSDHSLSLRRRLALEAWRLIKRDHAREHTLRQLFWECTLRCNLNCRHCGSDCRTSSTERDMPLGDFLGVLDQIAPHVDPHKVFVVITGGEPLMQPEFTYALLHQAKERGLHTCLETCGYAPWEKLEALIPFVRQAIAKSFSPTIANMAVMGLVSLPGTMIGQILGGSSPDVAIKYQIMIVKQIK